MGTDLKELFYISTLAGIGIAHWLHLGKASSHNLGCKIFTTNVDVAKDAASCAILDLKDARLTHT